MVGYPVLFKIDEIEFHLESIKNKQDSIDYLIYLREEFIKLCYHLSDDKISEYVMDDTFTYKYEALKYFEDGDVHQTHISKSIHIKFLEHIDNVLLPFVRKMLVDLDKGIKEDTSKIIKDYKIYGFDLVKVLEYSETLKEDKMAYLEWIQKEYVDYYYEKISFLFPDESEARNSISKHDFCRKIIERIINLKRYPGFSIKLKSIEDTPVNMVEEIFKENETLYEFDILKVKNHVRNIDGTKEQILYLQYVKKEAKQNEDILNKHKNYGFLKKLENEIDFYKEKFKLENSIPVIKETKGNSGIENPPKEHNLIKIRWQKDNVLIPYLFEVLLEEGFILRSDYDNRHKFIEQSFLKKNGQPFTSKESDQSEVNYRTNSKSDKKPRSAFKIDKLVKKLKNKKV